VKAAWTAYWKTIDRLIAAPDPDDPELAQRAVDPILSSVRDDMATRRSEGRTTRPPPNSKYEHHIQRVDLATGTATVTDCYIDDRIQFRSDGTVLNDEVSTVSATGQLTSASGQWKVDRVEIKELGSGDVGCVG